MSEGEAFSGPSAVYLSNVDTALDAYSPRADRDGHQIDDVQLRNELTIAVRNLRALGYLP
jgi:hypothetical protein